MNNLAISVAVLVLLIGQILITISIINQIKYIKSIEERVFYLENKVERLYQVIDVPELGEPAWLNDPCHPRNKLEGKGCI